MSEQNIYIKGARVNNLKNIDIEIPRNKLIVITGLSGSGKSSLAFDTLYAEGQRRYVESLSSYARQFLGRMSKPECDFIKGIPPAIAIEQKVNIRNSSSTVGTSTEIYDYLRMLFARIGHTFSPKTGKLVKKHTIEDIVAYVNSCEPGSRYAVLTPVIMHTDRSFAMQLDVYVREGFSRLEYKGKFIDISDLLAQGDNVKYDASYNLLIDRLSVSDDKDMISRLVDSCETAFYEGDEQCIIMMVAAKGNTYTAFSKRFESDGDVFVEPNDMMFNFNNPYGACQICKGSGKITGISEDLVVPNKTLSIYQDAVVCWRGEKMSEWKRQFIFLAERLNFPIHTPYHELTESQLNVLWYGKGQWKGIDGFFKMIEANQYKIQYRVMLARYRGKTLCPVCNGTRLRADAMNVKVCNHTIADIVKMPIVELKNFFENIELDEFDAQVAKRLITEINSRISFLYDIGLGYLTLDRLSSTLSGGESQRINLATSLGSSLIGSMYILDEPSIGLHSRDTEKLINILRKLQQLGNTVVIVEHDEDIMRAADYIIDIGPNAGRLGGEVVYQGTVENLRKAKNSYTMKYLTGELQIPVPTMRRKWNNYIQITGAVENNLKNIDVKIPLQIMTVVTGVSGSGKSTLVRGILYNTLARSMDIVADMPGSHTAITGDTAMIQSIEYVDQNPIGKSSRSNAVTYLKAFDEIRKLFADQQEAKQMGYNASYFSFNSEGGRCEECKGDGTITVEMQFMADIVLPCESCHGKRYKREVLDVEYKGANISDVLDMTVNKAIEFFSESNSFNEAKIVKRLKPLQDVGLGYIKLGQSSSTLSGGENQRVKLAFFLSNEKQVPTMFIFDEPTTGLHFHDINTLMKSFNKLIERGHTIVIIEHNIDVIKSADYVIDMGPDGGDRGGEIVCVGTPEEVAACEQSYTGHYLKDKL